VNIFISIHFITTLSSLRIETRCFFLSFSDFDDALSSFQSRAQPTSSVSRSSVVRCLAPPRWCSPPPPRAKSPRWVLIDASSGVKRRHKKATRIMMWCLLCLEVKTNRRRHRRRVASSRSRRRRRRRRRPKKKKKKKNAKKTTIPPPPPPWKKSSRSVENNPIARAPSTGSRRGKRIKTTRNF